MIAGLNLQILLTLFSIVFSAGVGVGIWKVYINHIQHLRKDIVKIFERMDEINGEIKTMKEWQRIYENKLNKLNGFKDNSQ